MDRANLYLVLEYVPGGDLGWVCSRSDDNRISEDDARFYASEILIALRYLHTMGIMVCVCSESFCCFCLYQSIYMLTSNFLHEHSPFFFNFFLP